MPPPSFNLKQRLAALSLAQSAPSSPHKSHPWSPNTKRKTFFNPPSWMKRPQEENSSWNGESQYAYGDEEKRMVQEVLARMVFQAGVDFEVVLNASALPDPQVVSYDLLLTLEADYTVVFFATGSKHAPSWNWVWKAYRSLSRKYRKNLKQLYIVQSSFFSKMLFSLAGAIISPKFFRKLVYLTTLSDLAKCVPLTQIDIPPAVYQENLKYERKITLPIQTRSSVFGVPLQDLMGYSGEKGGVPRVVKDAIQFLRDMGLQDEGLFRRSPSSSLLRAAQEAYDRGNVVSLENFADPHLAAVLLKKYLRDLPEPIFPESLYGIVIRCPLPPGVSEDHESEMASVQFVRDVLLPELVPCAYILLSHVLHLLHDVSLRSDYNRMDATNLAIVICPNLVKGANAMRDVMMCSVPVPGMTAGVQTTSTATLSQSHQLHSESHLEGSERTTLGMVIALCIRRYYEVFDEVVDRTEAVAPWRSLRSQGMDGGSSGSGSPGQATYVLGDGEEEEDVDDEMLVMPIGIEQRSHPNHPSMSHNSPGLLGSPSDPNVHYTTKRHRHALSNGNNGNGPSARSMFNDGISARNGTLRSSSAYSANGKARSMVSIEGSGSNGGGGAYGTAGTLRKGSIVVGRGSTRKGSGAAVEAVSVIAEGFFTPPAGAPPVPKRHSLSATPRREERNGAEQDGDEEPRLSVSERRRLFERGV
ncbi:hypothetical protein BDZ97DRAFT_1900560 [Flammula alnicola]|nr:hypothetical protein BDZ97DRAFT_1900560 [Flammula alnicola]